MTYEVVVTKEAEDDLFDICKYVAHQDGVSRAEALFEKLELACEGLSKFPRRGHTLPELENIEGFDFFEIHYEPYRVIYQISGKKVFIHCILDGRREILDLLQHRLIRGDGPAGLRH